MNKETKSQEAFIEAIDSGLLTYLHTTQTNHSSTYHPTRIVGVPNAQGAVITGALGRRVRRVFATLYRASNQARGTCMKRSNPTNYANLGAKPVLHITEAEKTARRLARAKTIPSFQLGRRRMCSRLALDEMIANLGGNKKGEPLE
jgi:hypothetical protein